MTLDGLFNLSDKTAIVTGGAGLLGQEFSSALISAGANVVIADLESELARKAASALDPSGAKVLPVGVDIRLPAAVQELVAEALGVFGKIDILVNSAAIDPKFEPTHDEMHTSSFEDYPLDLWNDALSVNLTGMFLVTQAAVKPMVESGHGVIINICSTYGLVGPDQRIYMKEGEPTRYKPVYYSVTKAAVLGFTRYLASYYAGKNIRVNALSPGGVYNHHDEEFVQRYSTRTILGRMAQKDEMNGALLFLASDASSYMTGANLIVDGGWTAW